MCLFVADPLPMKQRALPQSFWQEPNLTNPQAPGTVYSILPPLELGATTCDDTTLTPPSGETGQSTDSCSGVAAAAATNNSPHSLTAASSLTSLGQSDVIRRSINSCPSGAAHQGGTSTVVPPPPPPPPPERMITAANTDLLFSLFNSVEEEEEQRRIHIVRRGRFVSNILIKVPYCD